MFGGVDAPREEGHEAEICQYCSRSLCGPSRWRSIRHLDKNLSLLAKKYNVSIADARILQAGSRPSPVVAYAQAHQNVLGTGVTNDNNAGPSEWNAGESPSERLRA